MARRSLGTIGTRLGFGVWLALAAAGCGSNAEGEHILEKQLAAQAAGAELLKAKGAKFTEKQYKQGKAWAIDLSGMTITDDVMRSLQQVGHVTELNFNKSTLDDSHMAIINKTTLSSFLLVLDVGYTNVSDAGLEQLKDDGLLTKLVVTGSKVTPDGVAKWKKAREQDTRVLPMFRHPKIIQ